MGASVMQSVSHYCHVQKRVMFYRTHSIELFLTQRAGVNSSLDPVQADSEVIFFESIVCR